MFWDDFVRMKPLLLRYWGYFCDFVCKWRLRKSNCIVTEWGRIWRDAVVLLLFGCTWKRQFWYSFDNCAVSFRVYNCELDNKNLVNVMHVHLQTRVQFLVCCNFRRNRFWLLDWKASSCCRTEYEIMLEEAALCKFFHDCLDLFWSNDKVLV